MSMLVPKSAQLGNSSTFYMPGVSVQFRYMGSLQRLLKTFSDFLFDDTDDQNLESLQLKVAKIS